jgi:hypothetical protein
VWRIREPCPDRDEVKRRFYARLGEIGPEDGCWEWLTKARKVKVGYHEMPVHRLAYQPHYGDSDESTTVVRTCRNLQCVRYTHLEAIDR